MRFEGADPNAEIVGLDKLPGIVNYFIGSDPSKGARTSHVPESRIQDVYPGVDLVYYGNQGNSNTTSSSRRRNPDQIQLAFEGAEHMTKDEDGNCARRQSRPSPSPNPHVYQLVDGKRTDIAASYILHASTSALLQPSASSSTPL